MAGCHPPLSQTDHYLTADWSVTGKRPNTQSTGNEDMARPIELHGSAQEKGQGWLCNAILVSLGNVMLSRRQEVRLSWSLAQPGRQSMKYV